ncbi:GNAT family N-acetyltransferase [Clostridium bowmanii]|uniref:GNAT family N-acetyltransferase n=1 Tax=Clostridium bowmanii TaxID=132925 RepID=UPI001C0AEFA7|nr:GNAT family N-acetyltransferase [Clostridium bowmanii]MBU3189941.1 GNAT family N-acetyltransferase [Clostridium bowmanii]MCA1074625.1 GNAT family N-acetyltransferase [Clostridium bowmanii]
MEFENIIVRRFKNMDSSNVCEIIKQNLIEINSKDYPEEIINDMCRLYIPDYMIEKAKKRDIYVAELNGEIIGTASYENNIIYTVFVKCSYHKHGVGRKLISFIEDKAKRNLVNSIQISSSLTSLNFYYALGYKYVNEVEVPNLGKSIIVKKQLV